MQADPKITSESERTTNTRSCLFHRQPSIKLQFSQYDICKHLQTCQRSLIMYVFDQKNLSWIRLEVETNNKYAMAVNQGPT